MATSDEEMVVIWSGEHSAYWRENAAGYTPDHSQAGRYARTEAESLTSGCGPEKLITIIPIENLPSREIDELRAELVAEREKNAILSASWRKSKDELAAERDKRKEYVVLNKRLIEEQAVEIRAKQRWKERAERAEAACACLRSTLKFAIEDIADWGAYASEYFQDKHDLDGTIQRYKSLLESTDAGRAYAERMERLKGYLAVIRDKLGGKAGELAREALQEQDR